jgi:KUP system potassium uptake protein
MGKDLYNATLKYGFMDEPNVPEALALAGDKGLPAGADVTYFLGRETVIVTKTPGMAMWRERLFVLMAKNAVRATAFFRLPPDNVVELGVQVEL